MEESMEKGFGQSSRRIFVKGICGGCAAVLLSGLVVLSSFAAQAAPQGGSKIGESKVSESYYEKKDLADFPNIGEYAPEAGKAFFDYYGKVMAPGKLDAKTKALIAVSVATTRQCPYCIDATTNKCLSLGATEEEMMEAIQVGALYMAGATLAHSTQMRKIVREKEPVGGSKGSEFYYEKKDLADFPNIGEYAPEAGKAFFDYYGKVMAPGKLDAKTKALIAVTVATTRQCPYCIDATTNKCLSLGATEEEMMEAIQVGALYMAGATLAHSTQMRKIVREKEVKEKEVKEKE